MARFVTILCLAALAAMPPAAAQTFDQQESRRLLRESQRQMERRSFERDLDARERERAIQRRAERDALELRARPWRDPLPPLRLDPDRR